MTLSELLPALDSLDRTDKLKAVKFLVTTLMDTEVGVAEGQPSETASAADSGGELAINEALDFYQNELRSVLEPAHNGDNVAIHVPSRSFEVARGSGHALRALRTRHPGGPIVVHKIGPTDYGLVARMRGERLL